MFLLLQSEKEAATKINALHRVRAQANNISKVQARLFNVICSKKHIFLIITYLIFSPYCYIGQIHLVTNCITILHAINLCSIPTVYVLHQWQILIRS